MNATFATIGYVILSIAPIAQIYKTLRSKNTAHVAIFWPLLMLLGMFLIIPGVLDSDSPVLIWGHLSAIVTNTINFILILAFKKAPFAPTSQS